jgi:hypothetical protein
VGVGEKKAEKLRGRSQRNEREGRVGYKAKLNTVIKREPGEIDPSWHVGLRRRCCRVGLCLTHAPWLG